jgi:hypothetical protein
MPRDKLGQQFSPEDAAQNSAATGNTEAVVRRARIGTNKFRVVFKTLNLKSAFACVLEKT